MSLLMTAAALLVAVSAAMTIKHPTAVATVAQRPVIIRSCLLVLGTSAGRLSMFCNSRS